MGEEKIERLYECGKIKVNYYPARDLYGIYFGKRMFAIPARGFESLVSSGVIKAITSIRNFHPDFNHIMKQERISSKEVINALGGTIEAEKKKRDDWLDKLGK
jgi:hypothetical protein